MPVLKFKNKCLKIYTRVIDTTEWLIDFEGAIDWEVALGNNWRAPDIYLSNGFHIKIDEDTKQPILVDNNIYHRKLYKKDMNTLILYDFDNDIDWAVIPGFMAKIYQ